MAGARKQTRFLRDDELLAKFEALSDNDTSNSESESESESEGEEICDNFESDSPQDAAQHTKRRTSGPSCVSLSSDGWNGILQKGNFQTPRTLGEMCTKKWRLCGKIKKGL
jgi:hypothetical protein